MRIAVVTAADGAPWEAQLLTGLREAGPAAAPQVATPTGGRDPVVIDVVRRCVDVVELLAVGASGQVAAALVDAQLRGLDADAVQRLAAAGVAVVGVAMAESTADQARLHEVGIEFWASGEQGVGVLTEAVATAVTALPGSDPAPRAFADPAGSGGPLAAGLSVAGLSVAGHGVADGREAGELSPPRGSVIAVWGPTGAPGRTTTAVTLADELSRLGAGVLLVDADVYGGVAASTFGLLDESPGLVAACRQAQSHRLDGAALAALCWQISPTLRVLTGISRSDRWPELRPAALQSVLETARSLAEFTVLDLGFSLETDEELSFDTIAPRRNGATLTALDAADLIVAVGSADPIGMQRLVRGLEELKQAEVDAPVRVVLNRVRRSVVPGDPSVELRSALLRFTGQDPVALLPYDRSALDEASLAGRTLAEVAGGSALRRAVTELAMTLSGRTEKRGGRRRG